jgi:hypothetical protein
MRDFILLARVVAVVLLVSLAYILLKHEQASIRVGMSGPNPAKKSPREVEAILPRAIPQSIRSHKKEKDLSTGAIDKEIGAVRLDKKSTSRCAQNQLLIANMNVPVFLEPSKLSRRVEYPSGGFEILDPRNDVTVIEELSGWIRVKVVSPLWPRAFQGPGGWIERRHMHLVSKADETACLFVDPKEWGNVPPARAAAMRVTALRLLNEDKRCNKVFSGGYLGAGQKYYFDCYPNDGGKPYSNWFSLLTEDRPLAPAEEIAESSVISSCTQALKRRVAPDMPKRAENLERVNILDYDISINETVWQVRINAIATNKERTTIFCLADKHGRVEILKGPQPYISNQ